MAGSFASAAGEVLRFGDGPRVCHGFRETRAIPGRGDGKRLHGLLVVRGLVAIRFELAQDGALHGGGGIFGSGQRAFERQRDPPYGFGFQVPDRRAHQLAKLGGIELLALARAGQEHSLGRQVCWIMQQCQVERLAADLSRVERSGTEARFLLLLENRHDQGAGFNLFQWFVFERYLHHF